MAADLEPGFSPLGPERSRESLPDESLDLDEREISDLLAFLQSLTGSNVDQLVSDAHAAPIGGG